MTAAEWAPFFFLAAGAGFNLLLTPLARLLASRFNLMDRPGHRKIHQVPVPKVGGLVIFLSLILAVSAGWLLFGQALHLPLDKTQKTLFLLGFGLLGAGLGLVDDLYDLRPFLKLHLQALLAFGFAWAGYRFEAIHIPGVHVFALGWWGVPLTALWMMAVVNGLNFTDILDGLAGTVCLVGFLALGGASWLIHGHTNGLIWLSALGALVVFLSFNWKPAKVYLGDCGATGLGFFLSACWIALGNDAPPDILRASDAARPTEPFWFQFYVVSLFAAYPLLEAALSTLRRGTKRFIMNRSMEFSEKEHIGHRLMRLGMRADQICAAVAFFQTALVVAGLLLIVHANAFAVLIVLPLLMVLSFLLPRMGFLDFLDWRFIKTHQPHYQIAHHFIMVQRVKLDLALTRQEVLALVRQTCREFGVRCLQIRIFPGAGGRGGVEYAFQEQSWKGSLDHQEEFFDYYEQENPGLEAFWIFTAHTSDDELDVQYRVLMTSFIKKALEACARLGEGQENITMAGLSLLPHAKTSGHHLRRRKGRGWG